MKCQICNIDEATEHLQILDEHSDLCGFDMLKIKTFAHSMVYHEAINISWGAGRIDAGSWFHIRGILR